MLPETKGVHFCEAPDIFFNIGYALAGKIQMDILLKNNLSSSIYLLNLWIQVNKSDSNEKILVSSTKIIETNTKLSLSTFDTDQSMIFHLKLYEGEFIAPNEEYNITLSWDDPDNIYAQYDHSLLDNGINDDIQAYFHYSLETEEPQLFPLIEREFYHIDDTQFGVDFRVTNLMATDLKVFNFTYVKIKDYSFENYLDLEVESPFLSSSEISNIELQYNGFSNRIEYKVSFSQNVILEPDEWFKIKARWNGQVLKSTIKNDLVIWNTGKDDPFNYGYPFYKIGFPFYPILSPAEPILTVDYDGDGLRNFMELTQNLDPFEQEPWLVWQTLRSDYLIDSQYAKDLELGGKISIFIPNDFTGEDLIMDVQNLGGHDTLHDVKVNNEKVFETVTTQGEIILKSAADAGVHNVQFRITHDNTDTISYFKIKFLLSNREIIDLSTFFPLDSEGDGLSDLFEKSPFNLIPDIDNDGVSDGSDLMPFTSINCAAEERYLIDLPIYDSNSEVEVSLQIKPTENDYTDKLDFQGNDLYIIPGIRIFSEEWKEGDYLPDNSITIDHGSSGLVQLIPMRRSSEEHVYSWGTTLSYGYFNKAQKDRQIQLNFRLEWLLYDYDPFTKITKLIHIYSNQDEYTIQGIAVTENGPTTVTLGLVNEGESYRKTLANADLFAHLMVSNVNCDPADISPLVYEPFVLDPEIMFIHSNQYLAFSMEIDYLTSNDFSLLNATRDHLQTLLLYSNYPHILELKTTNFIYLTSGYTTTYNLDVLIDEFGYNPSKLYSDTEIESFFSRKENEFKGIMVAKLLRDKYEEFITEFVFGWKNKSIETKRFNLQISKCQYVGFSSDEILLFKGLEENKRIFNCIIDFEEKEHLIIISSGGCFDYFANLKIMGISLKGEMHPEPENFWDDIPVLGEIYWWYGNYFEHPAVQGIIKFIDLFNSVIFLLIQTGKLIQTDGLFMQWELAGKIAAVLSIIFGGMRLAFGINLIMQGAYKTGMAESFRGSLMVMAGILTLLPDPWTTVAGLGIYVFCLVDWLVDLAGFDLIDWWMDLFGFEDPEPDYEILNTELGPLSPLILELYGGFRVGSKIDLTLLIKNTGNTRLEFSLKLGDGKGNWGTTKLLTLRAGEQGSMRSRFNLIDSGAATTLSFALSVTWYFSGDSGGPYTSTITNIFDIPVFHNSIEDFIAAVKDRSWFFYSMTGEWWPGTLTTVIDDEITPGDSELLEYKVDIKSNSNQERTYEILCSNTELWTYYITSTAWIKSSDNESIVVTSSTNKGYITIVPESHDYFIHRHYIEIYITPTSINPLNSGDYSLTIRIQNQDISFSRTDVNLDFRIKPLIDFEVKMDPILIEGFDLYGDSYLPYNIDVTNIGSIEDTYSIEIETLDEDLFIISDPLLTISPGGTDSALITFFIPWGKIVLPGVIAYKIKVRSQTNPSIIKTYNCILNIQPYHRMNLNIETPFLNMSDSDIFNYNLQLSNLGNVETPFTISWTDVGFADTFIEENPFNIAPGQIKNFNLTLIPFGLGYENFTITATTPYISNTIDASIYVFDDDTHAPVVEPETVEIADNCHFLNISFQAHDLLEGDDIGIGSITIYVDDTPILNYMPTSYDTIFNFSLPNDWIIEYGSHTIEIEVTDADNDRPNDTLTTILVESFEVTPDEMMEYILWELSELKESINTELEFCFSKPLVNSLERAYCKVQKALNYYNSGYIVKATLFDMLAKAGLEFYDIFTYILLKHDKITEEIGDYISSEVHKIRDHLSLTMGGIVGTGIALEIADIIVEISQFADNISYVQNLYVFLSIDHHLWRAVDELDFVLVLLSADCMKECLILKHISNSICKLKLTITKIQQLEDYGYITETQCSIFCEEIDLFITKLNTLLEILSYH